MDVYAWITLITVIAVMGVLLLTKIRTDAVFLMAIGILFVTGVLDAGEACSGFSSSAVVVTGVLTVVVAGLRHTGVLQWTLKNIFGLPGSLPKVLLRMMIPVSVISAFINNTTVTALFSDLVKRWAGKLNIAASKLYLPMVYAVLMGGVCTLIGTPSNIVISELYEEASGHVMTMFTPLVPGVITLIVGLGVIILMRRWLPERKAPEEAFGPTPDYTVELLVPSDNPNIGKTLGEAGLFHVKGGNLIEIYHFDDIQAPVNEDEYIMGGDRLIYAGQIDEILELKSRYLLAIADHPVFTLSETKGNSRLRTASVPFGSSLIGETIGESRLEKDYNLILVAVARRGNRIAGSPREVQLEAGDTLLFECPRNMKAYSERLSSQLQFSESQEVYETGPQTLVSTLILTAMLILTSLNVVSLLEGTVMAALAMILCRCCSVSQAMDSINWNVLMGMAGSIVLGTAISKTGIAEQAANGILGLCGTNPLVVMVAICLVAAVFTQLVMNVAVGAMFFPIMYQAAMHIGYEPVTFLIALMIAVNTSFATPIGAPSNMMVYGPGGYRFSDFMRIGVPLTLIVTVTGIAAACLTFPLTPLP
jgi:di/tricarboxylate transporter